MKLLLDAGMPATVFGRPAIATAIDWGHLEVIQVLLQHGSDLDVPDDSGQTLVMKAVSMRRRPILEALIRAGADANTPNEYKTTPLMVAAGQGDVGIVKVLLDAGANVKARTADGGTALQSAVMMEIWR